MWVRSALLKTLLGPKLVIARYCNAQDPVVRGESGKGLMRQSTVITSLAFESWNLFVQAAPASLSPFGGHAFPGNIYDWFRPEDSWSGVALFATRN